MESLPIMYKAQWERDRHTHCRYGDGVVQRRRNGPGGVVVSGQPSQSKGHVSEDFRKNGLFPAVRACCRKQSKSRVQFYPKLKQLLTGSVSADFHLAESCPP